MGSSSRLPYVLIIVPGYNGINDSIECLASVLSLSYPIDKLEIIFVDNASKDNTPKILRRKFGMKIKIIELTQNVGYAKSFNIAQSKTKSDFLLILNNDVILESNSLKEMVKTLLKSKKYAVVGPKVYEYSERKLIQTFFGKIDKKTMHVNRTGIGVIDRGQYNKIIKCDYVAFCCTLIRRKALEDVGLLDENFFVYYEEVDFYLRLLKRGWEIVFCPNAEIWHKGARSSGDNPFIITYYLTRNNLYIRNKFNEFSLINHLQNLRYLMTSAVLGIIKPEYRAIVFGIKDFYFKKFGQAPFSDK